MPRSVDGVFGGKPLLHSGQAEEAVLMEKGDLVVLGLKRKVLLSNKM